MVCSCIAGADYSQFVDEIPKSPTGKIQRKLIREWVKDEEASKAKL